MKTKVDATRSSAVAVCGCGWRDLAADRGEALRLLADHERRCHPREGNARTLLARHAGSAR